MTDRPSLHPEELAELRVWAETERDAPPRRGWLEREESPRDASVRWAAATVLRLLDVLWPPAERQRDLARPETPRTAREG